jgi:hypothetical protein
MVRPTRLRREFVVGAVWRYIHGSLSPVVERPIDAYVLGFGQCIVTYF